MLRIYLFGHLHAESGGVPLGAPPRRHTERLWAYLLLHQERAFPRGEVADLLFADQQRPRPALRKHLYELLHYLPPAPPDHSWLVPDEETLRWNPEAECWVDVSAFEQGWARAEEPDDGTEAWLSDLAATVALYTGDLLHDLDDPWVVEHRESLSLRMSRLQARLCRAQADRGRLAEAINVAQAAVAREPLDEAAHALLIEVLARSGDPAGALHQFGICSDLLRQEVGVEPSAELTALVEEIRGGDIAVMAGRPVGGGVRAAYPDSVAVRDGPAAEPARLPDLPGPTVGAWRVEQAERLLAGSRLLTLTGPPGGGKSRIAIATARQGADTHPGDVLYVDLVAAVDVDGLWQAVGMACQAMSGDGVMAARPRETAVEALVDLVVSRLGDQARLVLLDNVDGVIEPVAALARALLAAGIDSRLLVTSRERLRLDAEVAWRVPLLALARPGEPIDPRLPPEAVALYLASAPAVLPGWAPSRPHLETIAALCHDLDGLPLAIRLAAEAIGFDGLDAVVGEGVDWITVLGGSEKAAGPGRDSLWSALGRAVALLAPAERWLLRRLAELPGGFSVDAAEGLAQAGGGPVLQLGTADGFELLERLVACSLVEVDPVAPPGTRYRLLTVVRLLGRAQQPALWPWDDSGTPMA